MKGSKLSQHRREALARVGIHSVIIPPPARVPDKLTPGERLQMWTSIGIAIVAGVLLGAMLTASYLHG